VILGQEFNNVSDSVLSQPRYRFLKGLTTKSNTDNVVKEMRHLEYLNAEDSTLSDECLKNKSKLKTLLVSERMTDEGLLGLESLESLYLGLKSNKITGSTLKTLSKLDLLLLDDSLDMTGILRELSLETLGVRFCNWNVMNEISIMTFLVSLEIAYINYEINDDHLRNLENLESLCIVNSNLNITADGISNLTKLKELRLCNNLNSNPVTDEYVWNLTNLHELRIDDCLISDATVNRMPNLVELDGCINLTGGCLPNLKNLRVLDISYNYEIGDDVIGQLVWLKKLTCNDNLK
jgi:Leucine-rich repeat (LRR) protein